MRRLPRGARLRREKTSRGAGQGAVREVPRRSLAGARRQGMGDDPPGARRRLLRPAISRTWPLQPGCSRISRRRCASAATMPSPPPTPARAARCTSRSPRGACSLCHAPHGSAVKKLLLASPGRELCLKCHKDPALDPGGSGLGGAAPGARRRLPVLPSAARRGGPAAAGQASARAVRRVPRGQESQRRRGRRGEPRTHPLPPGCAPPVTVRTGLAEKALLKKSAVRDLRDLPHRSARAPSGGRTRSGPQDSPRAAKATLPAGFPVRKRDGRLGVRRVSSTARLGQAADVEPGHDDVLLLLSPEI